MENSIDDSLEHDLLSLKINSKSGQRPDEISSNGESISNDLQKIGVCWFYSRQGHCKYGNKCKYFHYSNSNIRNSFLSKKFSETSKQKTDKLNTHTSAANPNLLNNSYKQSSIKKCKYFMIGRCNKGDFCIYDHSMEFVDSAVSEFSVNSDKFGRKPSAASNFNNSKKKSATPCHYYKKGFCRNGNRCKFYHQEKHMSRQNTSFLHVANEDIKAVFNSNHSSDLNNSVNIIEETVTSDHTVPVSCDTMKIFEKSICTGNQNNDLKNLSSTGKELAPAINTRNVYELKLLTEDDIFNIRNTEVRQLKRRFPAFKTVEEDKIYIVSVQPSDPDWPFDLKTLEIEIDIPQDYPMEVCRIKVVQSNENIPLLLINYLNKSIFDWLHEKHQLAMACGKIELIFRSFLKWFDRSLEELFICGLRQVKQDLRAKEAGIEFIPPEKLLSQVPKESCDNLDVVNPYEDNNSLVLNNNDITSEPQVGVKLQAHDNHVSKINNITDQQSLKITLSYLELTEGAAALTCTKISVTFQCCRCKTSFNMISVPKRSNSLKCLKCSKDVGFTFEAATLHPFSNVFGSFHLMDCLAVDINLIECHFLVDCLNCSKQVPTDGIHYGQPHKMWCLFCNQKLVINIGNVKFQASKMSSTIMKYLPAKKIQKKTTNIIINEGESLPQFGACKHYKKSFRWLRFPCCGRIYPCDECHNEKETDHEMKFANRMICGFCAKEQPYSKEKPCFGCSQSLTKKSGSHWEGGKGCRNKIVMGREDKQKYSGISKTVSKKSQNSKTKKK